MEIVANNTDKNGEQAQLTKRQRDAVQQIKVLIKNPYLSEWQRQHLKALIDAPLN